MNEIIIPIATALIAGILTWIAKELFDYIKGRKFAKFNFKNLSGKWYSIHITKESDYVFSRHRYDLRISNKGNIIGKLFELSTNPEWEYTVKGKIMPGGWVLTSISTNRMEEFAVEVYFNDLNQKRILGFLNSFDLERRPFCSFTILSREELSESDYYKELKKYRENFYVPTECS